MDASDKDKPLEPSSEGKKLNRTGGKLQGQTTPSKDGGKLPSNSNQIKTDYVDSSISGTLNQLANLQKKPQVKLSNYQTITNTRFYSNKLMNDKITESEIAKMIEMFSILTSSQQDKQQRLKQLEKPQGRQKFITLQILNGQDNQNFKTEVKSFFSLVIHQLLQENKYLSFKGALQLINFFIDVNKNIYYPNGRFNLAHITQGCNISNNKSINPKNPRNEPYFKKMIRQISQIRILYFYEYEKIFDLMMKDTKNNKNIANLKVNSNLIKYIWNSFVNIMNTNRQNQRISNSFELNILLKGLNIGLQQKNKYFDKQLVVKTILPYLLSVMGLIESSKITIQRFLLGLLLHHPYRSHQEWDKQVKQLLYDTRLDRFNYLRLLDNHDKQSEESFNIQPLASQTSLLFIERLIDVSLKTVNSPLQDSFIFKSICNILADNPKRFWLERNNYKNIIAYIWQIQQNISNYGKNEQNNKNSEFQKYLYTCKFAKIFNLLCLASKQSISIFRFKSLLRNKASFVSFLENVFEIACMSFDKKNEIGQYLYQYNTNTQAVYQFIHRLIIYDTEYFTDIQKITSQYFNSFQDVFAEFIVNYLRQYAEFGEYTHICIIAFNKILQKKQIKIAERIMKELSDLNKQQIERKDGENRKISYLTQLQYIIDLLFRRKKNLIPFGNHLLILLKNYPQFLKFQWVKKISAQFKEVAQKFHPQNIPDYAKILTICLKFVEYHPKSLRQIQKYFNFKFINNFLCHILAIDFRKDDIFNKFMRGMIYEHIVIAVRLLSMMTTIYIKQKQKNQLDLVPHEIRSLLEIENKNGHYQVTMGKEATSYSAALIVIYLSREFLCDSTLRYEHPNLKNQILQILVNLSKISIILKTQNSLVISSPFNKKYQLEIKQFNLKKLIKQEIIKHPSLLGLQYLITSGNIEFQTKKVMFQRVKSLKTQRTLQNIKIKSHFISVYWKEMENSKTKSYESGWEFIKHQINEIVQQLDNYVNQQINDQDLNEQDRQIVNTILQNIYKFSISIKSSLNYYTEFIIKFHPVFFDLKLNINFIMLQKRSGSVYQSYFQSLTYLLNCKSFLSVDNFNKIKRQCYNEQNQIYIFLKRFIFELLTLTYRIDYDLNNDESIFSILEFGLALMIDIGSDQCLNIQLPLILEKIIKRPYKEQTRSTKEILILLLLNGYLSSKIEIENVSFGNNYWPLLLNSVKQNCQCSRIILIDLQNIYHRHPIFFMSACNYLVQTVKTNILEDLELINVYSHKKSLVQILVHILLKSISGEKSTHIIWIIEVLIQILQNRQISQNLSINYYNSIRTTILSSNEIHQRIQQLICNIGQFYDKKHGNNWKLYTLNTKQQTKRISFVQKIELLAYVKLLTFITFNDKSDYIRSSNAYKNDSNEIFCNQNETKILQSMVCLLPLVSHLLKNEKFHLQIEKEWEEKLVRYDLTLLISQSIRQSGIRQFSNEKLQRLLKNKNGLDVLDEAANIQLASLIVMWIPNIKETQLFKKLYIINELSQKRVEDLLTFLEVCKNKLEHFSELKNELPQILEKFNNQIYIGSVEISKQLLFTNSQSLTSNLNISYEELMKKLRESFIFIDNVARYVFEKYRQVCYKSDHLIKSYKQILKNVKSLIPLSYENGQTMQDGLTKNDDFSKNRYNKLYS